MKRRWVRGLLIALAIAAVAFLVVASGVVPITASSDHWPTTRWLLHFAMRRSVATHSLGIHAPPLDDPALVLRGAGHYEGGCRPCHGQPGRGLPPIPRGMTPHPPELAPRIPSWDPEELFYIVKHGVKFTGMPAWPAPKREDEVWAVVAFLQRLPELDAREYRALVWPDGAPPEGAPEIVRDECARCHGRDGRGRGEGAFPRLAGQHEAYLRRALSAYASGQRHSGIMRPIAAGLDEAAVRELAVYYAGLRSDDAPSRVDGDARGRAIAERGIPEDRVPACSACHGPTEGPRTPHFPVIAGQYADYLAQQLELFQQGRRGGGGYARVMKIALHGALSAEERWAVARHYASLRWNAQR